MDEEITIIDTKTRNERIKNFIIEKKKLLISAIIFFILLIFTYYSYQIFKDNQKKKVSEKYNSSVIDFGNGNKEKTISSMKEVILTKDQTYSPLALYFLIDNSLLDNSQEINKLFDVLILETSLEKEIKNLIIYKKALFNADSVNENELLSILKPIINSNSVWKSHALYLAAEYFYSKNEKQKSKEFFSKILSVKNANSEIIQKAQKRLNRDLSD